MLMLQVIPDIVHILRFNRYIVECKSVIAAAAAQAVEVLIDT